MPLPDLRRWTRAERHGFRGDVPGGRVAVVLRAGAAAVVSRIRRFAGDRRGFLAARAQASPGRPSARRFHGVCPRRRCEARAPHGRGARHGVVGIPEGQGGTRSGGRPQSWETGIVSRAWRRPVGPSGAAPPASLAKYILDTYSAEYI